MNKKYLLRDLGRAQVSQLGGSRKSSDLIYSELARWDKSILASLGQQRRTAKRPPNLDDRFDAPVLMFHLWAEPKSLFVNLSFVLRSEGCPKILAEKEKLSKPIHLNLSGTIWNIGAVLSQAAALRDTYLCYLIMT